MLTISLSSLLFNRVLESTNSKLVVIVNHPINVGEKVAIMEASESEHKLRTPMFFRYVYSVDVCEFIDYEEVVINLGLSSAPFSVSHPQFGYQLHL